MINIQTKDAINIYDKSLTVIGMGSSGTHSAILANHLGAKVFISDPGSNDQINKNSMELMHSHHIATETGIHSDRIYDADLWIISPGVPKTSDIIIQAIEKNIPIVGEIEFSSWFTKSPIIAITGSNGKTTTSFIINEMCKTDKYHSVIAGNIGIPFSMEILKEIKDPNKKQIYILECSSFQMEFIYHFSPDIAVYTNISEDHLDRHKTMQEYIDMKIRLIQNIKPTGHIIYNDDDKILVESLGEKTSLHKPYSIENKDSLLTIKDNQIISPSGNVLINSNNLSIPGKHNLYNFLAAASCAHLLGIPEEHILNIMKNFKGIEHRLEHVTVMNNIAYINDSKATNIQSVIVALLTFEKPIILLLGGYNKGSDFRLLLPHIKSCHIRAIISYGEAGGQIKTALGDAVRLVQVTNLNSAVIKAQSLAKPGDIVLLSPGCASYDEFSDYEQRGKNFKKTIHELKKND